MTSEKSGLLDPDVPPPYWNDIRNPIGYGWCDSSKQLCVFDHTRSCRCANHPSQCGDLRRPRFIRTGDKETYLVKKAVEAAEKADSDLDPASHQ